MLNIRSLASSISSDPDLLLSMSELSRVRWKPGSRKGEIHVEIDAVEEGSYELHDIDPIPSNSRVMCPHTAVVHMSRVGMFDDTNLVHA